MGNQLLCPIAVQEEECGETVAGVEEEVSNVSNVSNAMSSVVVAVDASNAVDAVEPIQDDAVVEKVEEVERAIVAPPVAIAPIPTATIPIPVPQVSTELQACKKRMQYLERTNTLNQLQLRGYKCSVQNYEFKMKEMQETLEVQNRRLQAYERYGSSIHRTATSTNSLLSFTSSTSCYEDCSPVVTDQLDVHPIQQWLYATVLKATTPVLRSKESWMTHYCHKMRQECNIPLDRFCILLTASSSSLNGWMCEEGKAFRALQENNFNDKLAADDSCFSLLCHDKAKRVSRCKNNHQEFHVPGDYWFNSSSSSSSSNEFHQYFTLPIVTANKFVGTISWVTKTAFTRQHIQFFQESILGLSMVLQMQSGGNSHQLAMANAKLKDANARVIKQAQMQLRHFAMMSHEIRTPLNCIIGLSSLLLKDAKENLNDDQQEALKMVTSSGDLLLRVVDDVLNFSKLAAGEVVFHMEPTSLKDALNTVFHAIQTKAQQQSARSLRLRVRTPHPLPLQIVTDGRRLQQVLYNLLGNAFKFGKKGEFVDCTVSRVKDGDDDEMLQIVVKDYGVGVHPKHMTNIFQPFQQGSKDTERDFGGTGLGLAITSNLVKAMGGIITVQSEYGKWCQFMVKIPLIIPALPAGAITNGAAALHHIPSNEFKLEQDYSQINALRFKKRDETETIDRSSMITHPPNHEQLMTDLDKLLQEQQLVEAKQPIPVETSNSNEILDGSADTPNHEQLMKYLDRLGKHEQPTMASHEDTTTIKSPTSPQQPQRNEDSSQPPNKNVPPADSTTTNTNTKPIDPEPCGWKKIRVLVAEDNKINQKVCKRILTRIGISDIDMVDNGQKAVDQEAVKDYDLVLMDLEMPVMNGLDATKLIVARREKRSYSLPRILFLSAHALEEYKVQARDAGGDGFLSKPFRIEGMESSLKEFNFGSDQAVSNGNPNSVDADGR